MPSKRMERRTGWVACRIQEQGLFKMKQAAIRLFLNATTNDTGDTHGPRHPSSGQRQRR